MHIQRFAPAKINLMLHVVERLDTGYHRLQSLMTFVDMGDHLIINSKKDKEGVDTLVCTGAFAPSLPKDGTNSLIQAKQWFYHQLNLPEQFFNIQLEKNLPIAAGIGGGTSDAAAMIAALLAWHQVDLSTMQKQEFVKTSGVLGADVPVCLAFQLGFGSLFWLNGTGVNNWPIPVNISPSYLINTSPDKSSSIDTNTDTDPGFVLINPGIAVKTGTVFQALTPPWTPPLAQPEITSGTDLLTFIRHTHNDLEKAARTVYSGIPDIPTIITRLGFKTAIVRQSGSGATYFALTESFSMAQALTQTLTQAYPNWWIQTTRIEGKTF